MLETPLTKMQDFVGFKTGWGIGIVDSVEDISSMKDMELILISRDNINSLNLIAPLADSTQQILGLSN